MAAEKASAARGTSLAGFAGYLLLLAVGGGCFLLIEYYGRRLEASTSAASGSVGVRPTPQVDVLLHVLTTLAAVVGLGYLLARLLRPVRQPPVIGEVLAGIVIGPSVLGAVWPEALHLMIPPASVDPTGQVAAALKGISQLGVVLYMFLIGLELNAAQLAGRAHAAIAVSHSSIVVPFVLGAALALGLYPIYSADGVPFLTFAMFMGVAMAITAFPVLARILADRGLDKTEIGGVALSCAAADDVTAWCLLAVVVGFAQADAASAVWVVGGTIAYIALMFVALRPALRRLASRYDQGHAGLPAAAVSGTFLLILLSAVATEAIGVHALFGAFILGVVIPHDSRIAREFTSKLTDVVTTLLLPAFFAYTGMRTQINLLVEPRDWLWCAAVVAIAVAGKFGGTLFAARIAGLGWRDAAVLGTLMNTRGLMELIVLNVGLDLGVITPPLFAMMVIMALATTAITGPVLHWLMPEPPKPDRTEGVARAV